MSGQQGPPQWADVTPAPLNISALSNPVISFWSQALGGNVQVNLDPPPANANSTWTPKCIFNSSANPPAFDCSGFVPANAEVVIFKESFVRDFSNIGTLSCLMDCPQGSSFTPNSTGAVNPQNDNTINSFQLVAPASAVYKAYTISNGILTDTGGAVTIADTATIDPTSQYSFGYWSGPLFTDAEKANLACDFDSNATCGWQAWSNLNTFYTWETGPNDWNRMYIVKDEVGALVNFDPPIHVNYTYQSTGDAALDAKYGGATPSTFFLEYGGFGDLWGLPSHCVDDGGNEVNCDTATGFVRWVQEFAIPDGATATFTDTDGTASTGYILALEKEQRMKAKSTCSVQFDSTLTLPDPSSSTFAWSNPRTTEWPTGYAAMPDPPELTGAPAVVNDIVEITVQ
jgi:hypothetical protein